MGIETLKQNSASRSPRSASLIKVFLFGALFGLVVANVRLSSFAVVDGNNAVNRNVNNQNGGDAAEGIGAAEPKRSTKTCMGLESQSINRIISETSQIFITMATKAAGSSLKAFATKCTKSEMQDNVINFPWKAELSLMENLEWPRIIASHVLKDIHLVEIIHDAPPDTLLIHIYRDETDRLLSAIQQVVHWDVCTSNKGKKKPEDWPLNVARNDTYCLVEEESLVQMIKKKPKEIGLGNSKIFTCHLYDVIDNNKPNMVFINYKDATKLQALLAKHYCPEFRESRTENTAESKNMDSIYVRLKKNVKEKITLKRWLSAKAQLLAWSLQLQNGTSCHSRTRKIAQDLQACEDGVMKIH